MKKFLFAAAAATTAFATPAMAQDSQADFHAGATVGYHQIETIDFNDIGINAESDIDGMTYGGFAGVTVPVGEQLFAGAEGEFRFGTDAIDNEYGVSGIFGTKVGENTRLYVRGGYQWIEYDIGSIAEDVADDLNLSGADRDAFVAGVVDGVGNDDNDSGFLVGAGADIGLGEAAFLRLGADTIEFDTLRLTAGVGINF